MNPFFQNNKKFLALRKKYLSKRKKVFKKQEEFEKQIEEFEKEIGLPELVNKMNSIDLTCNHTHEDGTSALSYDERATASHCSVCNDWL